MSEDEPTDVKTAILAFAALEAVLQAIVDRLNDLEKDVRELKRTRPAGVR